MYSKSTKQDAVFSKVLGLKLDFKARTSKNRLDGEPLYSPKNTYTPQTLIDSGKFRFKGERIILE